MRMISIAILFSFLAGCSYTSDIPYGAWNDKTAWQPDPVTGCLIDQYYVKRLDAGTLNWKGQCINGFAIGPGTLSWLQADGSTGFWATCLHPEHPMAGCSLGGSARGG